jgi:hypothetical protein
MRLEYLIALCVLAGISAAGLVWFGGELLQNLWAVLRASRAKRNLVAQAAAIGRRAADAPPPASK